MPSRSYRRSGQIGTAGMTPLDNPSDSSIENLDPDPITGRLAAQDDNLDSDIEKAAMEERKNAGHKAGKTAPKATEKAAPKTQGAAAGKRK